MRRFWKKNKPEEPLVFLTVKAGDGGKLSERAKLRALEDSFLSRDETEIARSGKNFLGLVIANRRLSWVMVFIVVIVAGLFVRGFYLQVWRGAEYAAAAEKNRVRINHLVSPRGLIYDRNGLPLVKNIPAFSVSVTPAELPTAENERERIRLWLEALLPETEFADRWTKLTKLKPSVKEYFDPISVAEDVSSELAMKIKMASADYRGVSVQVSPKREYLTAYEGKPVVSLAHLLGYVGKMGEGEYDKLKDLGYLYSDSLGKTGLEFWYEDWLRGRYGEEKIEIDAFGQIKKIIARQDMRKGDNLSLSLDLPMQAKLEEILNKHLIANKKSKAVAVVLDPADFQVLAMVSLPAFDNNLFSGGISGDACAALITNSDQPLYNRAISGEYPPGSTFKTLVGAAALEEGLITTKTSFLSVGGLRVGQWLFPDWRAGGHGLTNIYKAIADSVNTFFYIIGGGYQDHAGLGVLKIKEYAEKFGLNGLTGIDLPNEKDGFLPTPEWKESAKNERWYIGDTYHLSIGQGDALVTPLQVAVYNAIFANGGDFSSPRILASRYDQVLNRAVVFPTELKQAQVVSATSIGAIRAGMRAAVTSGSAKILGGLPVTAAAKTGTAEWNKNYSPHAWFMAFAPYEKPEISLVVLVEEGEEGSKITAQIAYEFLSWYFREYRQG